MKKFIYICLLAIACTREADLNPNIEPGVSIEGKWWATDSTLWYYDLQPSIGKMYINTLGDNIEGELTVTDSILWMEYSSMRRKYTYICRNDSLLISTTPPTTPHTSVYFRFR